LAGGVGVEVVVAGGAEAGLGAVAAGEEEDAQGGGDGGEEGEDPERHIKIEGFLSDGIGMGCVIHDLDAEVVKQRNWTVGWKVLGTGNQGFGGTRVTNFKGAVGKGCGVLELIERFVHFFGMVPFWPGVAEGPGDEGGKEEKTGEGG
jgi:hypothetical protein